jgi:O-antigen/teichoic acid export membrane protein
VPCVDVAVVVTSGRFQSTAARLQLTVITSLVVLLATVASGVILARALGPSGRGMLTAAMLFGPLFATVGALGIPDALVYQSGRDGSARSPALVTALYIGAAQSLVLLLAGWALVPLALGGPSHSAVYPALAYLGIIPLYPLNLYPMAVLQGRLRLVQFNLVRASVPVLYSTSLLLLWRLGAVSVEAALAAAAASTVAASVLALSAAAKFSTVRASLPVARKVLGFGLRAHLGNLATIVSGQLDLLMLTVMVPSKDLGFYAVATSAAMVGSLIPTAASMVIFPTLANQSAETVPRSLARFLLWGLGGALLLTPILVVAVPWAVIPVYGTAFRTAAPISLILVPGYILRGSNLMLVAILRGSGSPLRASAGQIVGLVVLASVLPIGISVRGAAGAALSVTLWPSRGCWSQPCAMVGYHVRTRLLSGVRTSLALSKPSGVVRR